MQKLDTNIEGAFLLRAKAFADDRGYFIEAWNRRVFTHHGIVADFVQDNHSRSSRNVLRGLHYQVGEAVQGKLVWVTQGKVFDVIVDLRRTSPTFGQWDAYTLEKDRHEFLWVPPGCAHGFLVLSETADFQYKCTSYYDSASERSLRWDDPELAIPWPLEAGQSPILSAKDAASVSLAACEKFD